MTELITEVFISLCSLTERRIYFLRIFCPRAWYISHRWSILPLCQSHLHDCNAYEKLHRWLGKHYRKKKYHELVRKEFRTKVSRFAAIYLSFYLSAYLSIYLSFLPKSSQTFRQLRGPCYEKATGLSGETDENILYEWIIIACWRTYKWTNGQVDGRTNSWTDIWMDGRLDGWVDFDS